MCKLISFGPCACSVLLFNVDEFMKTLYTGVAPSMWKHSTEDRLTDGTVGKHVRVLYATKTFWQFLCIFSFHNICAERLEEGYKQRWFGDSNAVPSIESHDHEVSVTILWSLAGLFLADHTVYDSGIYGDLLIFVFHVRIRLKNGVIWYGVNEFIYFEEW
jgi:hypothetical protein